MTTTTRTKTHTEADAGPSTTPSPTLRTRQSRALAVRRAFLIASPVLAGVFAVIGAYADPGAGISGRAMLEIYTAHPEPLQFKSLGFHWAYAFWIAPALLAVPYVRGRGAWLANVAGLIAFGGLATMPGLLLTDWYDSAIGQLYGVDAAVAVQDHMTETMWGLGPFIVPGMLGLFLGLPLITIALWRARLVRWWAFVAVLGGYAAFMLSGVLWWGCAITTVCFTVFAVALAKGTRPQA